MNLRIATTALFLLASLHAPLTASTETGAVKRGWWWGEKTPEPEQKTEKEYKEIPPPPPQAELMKMHPKQLEQLLKDHMDQATWKTTPQNVQNYYLVQDVVRKKSLAFAAVTGLVMQQSPYLDVSAEDPSAVPARDAATRMRKESVANKLKQYRNSFALLFFTSKSCQWCEVQRGATILFSERHGWNIKELDVSENPAAAARFGAEVTPFLVMIDRDSKKWLPIAVGVRSLPALEDTTYRSVRLLRGEISPDQFYTMDYQDGGVFDPSKTRRQ